MNKTTTYTRTICEIGIFAAIGFVLDELQGILSKGLFINGGSIGFAMIAVLIIGFRRGWLPAIITGLIMGLFDIATSAYILHPAQLFLDYILPYAFVGIGCLFKYPFDNSNSKNEKNIWLVIATIVGGMAKFVSHYLAGVIFWADPNNFAWNLNQVNPYLYCFIYNFAFIGPSIVITAALLVIMFLRVPKVLTVDTLKEEQKDNKNNVIQLITVSTITTGGLFTFVWYLIDYIKSFSSYKDDGAIGYDFNPDSMVIVLLSLFIIVLGVFAYIKIFKSRYSPVFYSNMLIFITSLSFIYCLSRLIRMYVKKKDPSLYWVWFAIGLSTIVIFTGLSLYQYFKRKKEINVSNQ